MLMKQDSEKKQRTLYNRNECFNSSRMYIPLGKTPKKWKACLKQNGLLFNEPSFFVWFFTENIFEQ